MRPPRLDGAAYLAASSLVLWISFTWSNIAASSTIAANVSNVRLTPDDLVRLSDFGPSSPGSGEHIMSLSPDRKMAAVQVRTADPSSNRYRIRIDVVDLTSLRSSRTIDEGGDLTLQFVSGIGGATVSTGYAAATPLIWSSDGKWVYFLKRSAEITQVWRAAVTEECSEAVTHEVEGVDNFLLLADDRRLVYSSRQRDFVLEAALEGEALRGFRYDSRFIPLFSDRPQDSVMTRVTRAIDLPTDRDREANADEAAALVRHVEIASAGPLAISKTGRRAFVSASGGQQGSNSGSVAVRQGNDREEICNSADCSGVLAIWWTKDGNRVRFIRRYGWGNSEMAIFEWKPGASQPKRLYVTQDLLLDCQPVDDDLVCARERSADPRHIVVLYPDSGRARVIYDPNQEFHRLSLGGIERLHWRNEFGIETFGDLVYPVGYVRGRTYPLIVVQYTSRGFLRGGVGDEFPIQAFANRGYAVLSVQRPDASFLQGESDRDGARNGKSIEKLKDRRSVLSSIETAVQSLVDRGVANPLQLGITGLSDGSSTVQFALINSSMFRAASVSGCCWDPFQDAIVGPGAAEAFHESGWPKLIGYNSDFWAHMSLIENAQRISTPLLIQQSDDEFRGAITSYTALKQANRSVALYVFPNEHHVKWQPAHRLAAYERNLRWFDYWLRGVGNGQEWQSDN